jgi:hypothetical protein
MRSPLRQKAGHSKAAAQLENTIGKQFPLVVDRFDVLAARRPESAKRIVGVIAPKNLPPVQKGWPPRGWKHGYCPANDSSDAMTQWIEYAITQIDALQNWPGDKEMCGAIVVELVHDARLLLHRRERQLGGPLGVTLDADQPPASSDRAVTELKAFSKALAERRTLAGETNQPTGRRRPRQRNDPKAAARRAERKQRWAIDAEIFKEWRGGGWSDYDDYVGWKNEHLPDGWPTLNYTYVRRAIERHTKRLKRQGKWPQKQARR